ncbi:19821_t:CDS:2 [Funneliformis geosporum]|uniref:19821_t:CDS:1 n=1 Tax=Funneliformis geosporum TaxID=1117311 RepID=A0A9W4SRV0_9GLOM|nr:19821_t:CDS:2 [Funneliformis geosporum]
MRHWNLMWDIVWDKELQICLWELLDILLGNHSQSTLFRCSTFVIKSEQSQFAKNLESYWKGVIQECEIWVGLAEFTRKWHKKDNESDISSNSDEVNFEKVFEGEFFDGFHDREDDNGNSSDSKSLDSHSSRQRRTKTSTTSSTY